MYRPGVIVLQCGADSLAGDRLGCFNLSIDGACFNVINGLWTLPPQARKRKERKKTPFLSTFC